MGKPNAFPPPFRQPRREEPSNSQFVLRAYVPFDANDPNEACLLRVGGRRNHFFSHREPRRHFMPIMTAFLQLIISDPRRTDFQAFDWSASIFCFFELLHEESDSIFHEREP